MRYSQPDDPRFIVEPQGGDLVAAEDFCFPTDPPWQVQLTVHYLCEKTKALLSPASHSIKVSVIYQVSGYVEFRQTNVKLAELIHTLDCMKFLWWRVILDLFEYLYSPISSSVSKTAIFILYV